MTSLDFRLSARKVYTAGAELYFVCTNRTSNIRTISGWAITEIHPLLKRNLYSVLSVSAFFTLSSLPWQRSLLLEAGNCGFCVLTLASRKFAPRDLNSGMQR